MKIILSIEYSYCIIMCVRDKVNYRLQIFIDFCSRSYRCSITFGVQNLIHARSFSNTTYGLSINSEWSSIHYILLGFLSLILFRNEPNQIYQPGSKTPLVVIPREYLDYIILISQNHRTQPIYNRRMSITHDIC